MSGRASKSARNERRKLTASFINGVAIAEIILGVLRPIFDVSAYTGLSPIMICLALGIAVHMFGRQFLAGLED